MYLHIPCLHSCASVCLMSESSLGCLCGLQLMAVQYQDDIAPQYVLDDSTLPDGVLMAFEEQQHAGGPLWHGHGFSHALNSMIVTHGQSQ